ncbi:hypothetical protein DDE18_08595 [Nocardioides gansuensis]|uniref:ATP synthase protein I n=1 Tax=Nocardioides gansuensis TaxID=2138300 RepID=A0A2T8FCB2_9ACTN|nr:hypothetical protein [Nocardioides gansuensis]PVG83342.1 hypothetical protein DDE18_08595 [Nocardioides gansuensis]
MTTEQQPGTRGSGTVLLGAALGAALVLGLLGVVAGFLDGSAGALGALAGGGLALLVFALGTGIVHVVSGVLPAASLLVALLTYTLQLVVMALVVVAFDGSGLMGEELSRGWFAGGVVAATVAWLATQVWRATHLRLPAYDLPGTGPDHGHRAGAR